MAEEKEEPWVERGDDRRWMDGWMSPWVDESSEGRVDPWIDEPMDGWMSSWMCGWISPWVDQSPQMDSALMDG